MREKALRIVTRVEFQAFIMAVIVLNSIGIGIETANPPEPVSTILVTLDYFCLFIYAIEAALKLNAYGLRYFKDPWNVFDFLILIIAIIPLGPLPVPVQVARVLRIMRVFRVFKLVTAFKHVRIIIEAVVKSIPGVMWTMVLLAIILYVFAVTGVSVFGRNFPDLFGDLGKALFTLFQMMTFEGWAGDVARPIMEVYPWAWAYFIPYVCIAAFIMTNVVVGIIVGTVDESRLEFDEEERNAKIPDSMDKSLCAEIKELRDHLDHMERLLYKAQLNHENEEMTLQLMHEQARASVIDAEARGEISFGKDAAARLEKRAS